MKRYSIYALLLVSALTTTGCITDSQYNNLKEENEILTKRFEQEQNMLKELPHLVYEKSQLEEELRTLQEELKKYKK